MYIRVEENLQTYYNGVDLSIRLDTLKVEGRDPNDEINSFVMFSKSPSFGIIIF